MSASDTAVLPLTDVAQRSCFLLTGFHLYLSTFLPQHVFLYYPNQTVLVIIKISRRFIMLSQTTGSPHQSRAESKRVPSCHSLQSSAGGGAVPKHFYVHRRTHQMNTAKDKHCAWWPHSSFVAPCRNGVPEACRPRGLATTRPGTAHPTEAVSLPVHRTVPGADRPIYPLHSGAVHKVPKECMLHSGLDTLHSRFLLPSP